MYVFQADEGAGVRVDKPTFLVEQVWGGAWSFQKVCLEQPVKTHILREQCVFLILERVLENESFMI